MALTEVILDEGVSHLAACPQLTSEVSRVDLIEAGTDEGEVTDEDIYHLASDSQDLTTDERASPHRQEYCRCPRRHPRATATRPSAPGTPPWL